MINTSHHTSSTQHQCAAGKSNGLQCARRTTTLVEKTWKTKGDVLLPLCPQHRIPGKAMGYYMEAALPR